MYHIIIKPLNERFLQLKDKYAVAKGFDFHEECGKCSSCGKSILNDPFYKDGKGKCFCVNCKDSVQELCSSCNEYITDKCINALGKFWHLQHFTCAKCKKVISQHYNVKEELPYCVDCMPDSFSKCKGCL